tara:strand:+ start:8958 stop:10424 length:1467 start_codon:yes stop_codon:yes gene_type:complete
MTRVFIGGIATESNTFATIPTTMADYESLGLFHGDATARAPEHFTAPLHVWRKNAEAAGFEVFEGLMAAAQPGGVTLAKVWKALRDELLVDVAKAGPIDIVALNLHGAMIADGEDDCEGVILEEIRKLLPDAIIGCELDLHCHLTDKMIDAADVIVSYKEYPHTDTAERAEDLWDLLVRTHRGEIKPVAARAEMRMLSVWHTTTPPMTEFVQSMFDAEGKDGILSISFCHGFAYGDIPAMGSNMLVYADDNAAKAQQTAQDFKKRVWDLRHQTRPAALTPDEGIAKARDIGKPCVVLADTADNAGTGAGTDSTYMITALQKAGVKGAIVGMMFDPVVVGIVRGAGVGATLTLRIGGKFSPRSGPPLDLEVRVHAIQDDHRQTTVAGQRMRCGNCVVLETKEGVLLVLNDVRTQTFNPDAFTGLGLDPANAPIVVVKSTQHFYAGFAPIASATFYVKTDAAIRFEGPVSPYVRRNGNYWPVVEDPFAVA